MGTPEQCSTHSLPATIDGWLGYRAGVSIFWKGSDCFYFCSYSRLSAELSSQICISFHPSLRRGSAGVFTGFVASRWVNGNVRISYPFPSKAFIRTGSSIFSLGDRTVGNTSIVSVKAQYYGRFEHLWGTTAPTIYRHHWHGFFHSAKSVIQFARCDCDCGG